MPFFRAVLPCNRYRSGIAQYVPHPMAYLETDGFGRSDGRGALRDFFEVEARYVALAALSELAKFKWKVVQDAM